MSVVVECLRCAHILVDRDEIGWYYQVPVTSPEAPGLTFMDRVHECEGQLHLLGEGVAQRAEALEKARQQAETERYKAWLASPEAEAGRTLIRELERDPEVKAAHDAIREALS